VTFSITDFNKDRRTKDGHTPQCRYCRIKAKKLHYDSNRERILADKKKEYKKTADKQRARSIKYYYDNKDSVRKRQAKYLKEYRSRDENRIIHNVRSRVRFVCKGIELPKTKMKYLGCTGSELKAYLESQFIEGMTWDNYGTVWHVDHKLPLSWIDVYHEGDRSFAFSYKNLQPMFAVDNIRKGGRRADVQSNR
jgi:hypothetical protein